MAIKRKKRPARAKHKAAKKRKRKVVRRPRRKVGVKRKPVKRKAAKRRRRSPGRKLVKQVERRSVERVMAGKRRRRLKRKVVMAGTRRRRVSGEGGSSKMLIGLAIGAAAIYFLTKKSTATTYPTNYQLPPLTQTSNYTRNTQSQDIVNYALAAGLAVDAITKLIERLNSSSDQEVQNIYETSMTTGDLPYYV